MGQEQKNYEEMQNRPTTNQEVKPPKMKESQIILNKIDTLRDWATSIQERMVEELAGVIQVDEPSTQADLKETQCDTGLFGEMERMLDSIESVFTQITHLLNRLEI